ncbi:MAG: replication-associated recombination protein A [Bacteroidota bacterium]|nr:replication-associated recombination protein A [Bacteroidota bacterium]
MAAPLAERLRPTSLDNYIGQEHLVGADGVIRKMIENNSLNSFILWGPPGTGKTTLAKIIANTTNRDFFNLSAVNSGVKDVRNVIEKAKKLQFFDKPNPIVFIDEIHRFNKAQQDAFLGAVEDGTITLIGATTENPSFEVISALLSRCSVYILKPLSKENLLIILQRALKTDYILKEKEIKIKENEALLYYSSGDARKLLNVLETVISTQNAEPIYINNKVVESALQNKQLSYDKKGEQHYDIISAFIKSIRGSDPDAAVYWLARMIEAGEDVKFIARRLIISAAEDIGLANPNALLIAQSCFQSVHIIGFPESRIILSEATIYLASSAKSNSAYEAINLAQAKVKETGNLSVPLHLRNAPTKLMKELGYGANYKYSHSFPEHFVEQQYLPDEIANQKFYKPADNIHEIKIFERLKRWWKNRY